MADYMLTTIDNPYNPFKQFEDWFAFDCQKGYFTCSYLARLANTSDSLSDVENEEIIDDAMQEIIDLDPIGIYMKISENTEPKPIDISTLLVD